ncbi:hypothetical protein [Lactiplantibacillus mudanjiangensis]|uniref:Uncharacterized protein n=1 Tax=Lactiplantibacillus mudanjiangensis TaxID=1296538 RepID=A0A660E3E4_9LACO|nr:hypothetical protein [Lactiplantibacillus mudanjiangensis]VDG20687.1 hypothetical protein MUDAN_BIHEEGNE_02297 [Lactiplantibacillus mudanjiangensis]VDG24166.1 hypothetical protein MUDAN_IGPPGNFN_02440 [Lactiplantibacillus mudanjiangensis]VDG30150.1 hypothetical protein MUDAN_MDHGFNIF_01702 [Lactiplantibacillus mudanjiangensis]VDG30634.1 hypothetical protein MUDAN_DOGOELCO_00134 [Lactiplantibacillus mudanjiangensis]
MTLLITLAVIRYVRGRLVAHAARAQSHVTKAVTPQYQTTVTVKKTQHAC